MTCCCCVTMYFYWPRSFYKISLKSTTFQSHINHFVSLLCWKNSNFELSILSVAQTLGSNIKSMISVFPSFSVYLVLIDLIRRKCEWKLSCNLYHINMPHDLIMIRISEAYCSFSTYFRYDIRSDARQILKWMETGDRDICDPEKLCFQTYHVIC